MPAQSYMIELSEQELREVAGYAADCAQRALPIFERDLPADTRPRDAIAAAHAFAGGGRRTGALRQSAWAANRAAQEATSPAARDAAGAASHAAAAVPNKCHGGKERTPQNTGPICTSRELTATLKDDRFYSF